MKKRTINFIEMDHDQFYKKVLEMNKMKLEQKHIAPYLPYGLKIMVVGYNRLNAIVSLTPSYLADTTGVKLILRPLSDLTKEIEVNGERFVPDLWFNNTEYTDFFEDDFLRGITRRERGYNIKQCSFRVIQKLLEWHFDIFGLIEEGLASDINTLQKNTK